MSPNRHSLILNSSFRPQKIRISWSTVRMVLPWGKPLLIFTIIFLTLAATQTGKTSRTSRIKVSATVGCPKTSILQAARSKTCSLSANQTRTERNLVTAYGSIRAARTSDCPESKATMMSVSDLSTTLLRSNTPNYPRASCRNLATGECTIRTLWMRSIR